MCVSQEPTCSQGRVGYAPPRAAVERLAARIAEPLSPNVRGTTLRGGTLVLEWRDTRRVLAKAADLARKTR